MADKYLSESSGLLQEVEATAESAGAANAGELVALDADGRLDESMMPVGIAADITSAVASEALSAGNYVNLYNASGTLKARKADATDATKPAHGFVADGFDQDATASVYSDGTNANVSGKTIGAKQFLSTTPGATTEAAPSASGNIVQSLGVAKSATEIVTEISTSIIVKA